MNKHPSCNSFIEIIRATFFISLLILSGCNFIRTAPSSTDSELPLMLEALEGKDPLILSEENEHLAPNRLVHLLREESSSLKGFILRRGIPDAVRVVDSSQDKSKVDLYYLSPDELFRIEQEKSVWVILGPTQIQRDFLLPLKRNIRKTISTQQREASIAPPLDAPSERFLSIEQIDSPNSLREEVLKLTRGSTIPIAERNEKGDVSHRVISRQENMLILALWYTFEKENAPRLARMNGKQISASLEPGELVQIPAYLVKNDRVLEAENASKIAALIHQ